MSLELALTENTAALTRVADLLEVSNADRAKLLASAGAAPLSVAGDADDGKLTVAAIKEAAATADLSTLETMLGDEKAGANRTSAVKAIEAAIAAKGAGKVEEQASDGAAAAADPSPTPTSSASSAANDKNAQPVPATVTAEQAAQAFGAWFGETDEEAERAVRRGFVEQIVGKLGSKISELDSAKARQSVFYLRRKRAGLDVDFAAAYDFDGSPTQDAPAAAAAAAGDDLL